MFDEAFVSSLPGDPYEAVKVMCDKFYEEDRRYVHMPQAIEAYDRYIEAFTAMEAYITATGLPFSSPTLEDTRGEENIKMILNYFSSISEGVSKKSHQVTLSRLREKYAKIFGTTFVYQFSDGDIARIQQLINELRDIITKSELFDAKHKQRILNKLEGLQSELHKKMSNLDRLWGLIGDAGVALGKFGQDAKPLVDRIREIAQITWRTQARAEELPSGTTFPLLTEGKKEG